MGNTYFHEKQKNIWHNLQSHYLSLTLLNLAIKWTIKKISNQEDNK